MFDPSPALLSEWSFGAASHRPVRIFASINTRCFGEFVSRLFYVNTVATQFDHAAVTLLYRDDRDFKSAVVRLIPTVATVAVPDKQFLPSLDIVSPRTICMFPGFEDWHERGLHQQDIVITEGMATEVGMLGFERHGYLRFAETDVPFLIEALRDAGVSDDWFVTMHARESGYPFAANNTHRNANQDAYLETARHIIAQGGQVVRLGHPEMTPWPDQDGLIQLGLEPGTSLLQAFAVSRARYFVGGPTGPMALAEAFHVPTAYANSWDLYFNNDRAVVRTVDLVAPDGEVFNQARIVDMIPHGMKPLLSAGYVTRQIDGPEMIRLTSAVHRQTEGVSGWRAPEGMVGHIPNQLVWPGTYRPRARFLEDGE